MKCSNSKQLLHVFRENGTLDIYNFISKVKEKSVQINLEIKFIFKEYDWFVSQQQSKLDIFDINNLKKPRLSIFDTKIENCQIVRDRRERFLVHQTRSSKLAFFDMFSRKKKFSVKNPFNLTQAKITNNLKFYICSSSSALTLYSLPKFEKILEFEKSPNMLNLSLIKMDNSKIFLASTMYNAQFSEVDLEYLRINKFRSVETQTETFTNFELKSFIDPSMGIDIYNRIQKKPSLLESARASNQQIWTECSTRSIKRSSGRCGNK